jgi:ubiquinone/menaquinone biosynthesis C-methylase UbiE
MGYVFDYKAAREYDHWYRDPKNRFVAELEDQLMFRLLGPEKGERLLDIGCGTGRHLLTFSEMGLDVTGLDASPYMLEIARKRLRHKANLHEGFAEDLPFEDNSFDIATIVTTLEFVDDAKKTIAEACRVAKERVFLGVLNRYATKAVERRVKGIFVQSVYNRARFFSVWSLTRYMQEAVGKTPMVRGTALQFPASFRKYTGFLERSSFVQKSPFGAFIGMSATLIPRFRTTSLPIDYVRKPRGAVSGFMRTGAHSNDEGR